MEFKKVGQELILLVILITLKKNFGNVHLALGQEKIQEILDTLVNAYTEYYAQGMEHQIVLSSFFRNIDCY